MALTFDPHQRRVLGVLIEKSMTTPGSYPLTINSLVTGCNQLSCRDPVMHLTEGQVAAALHELQRMQVAAQAPPDRNARSNRFIHRVEERLGWDTRERAIMAELLLRGPQTPGELKSNASRMSSLDDLNYVMELLGGLAQKEPPFVVELPRQPGKSANKFDHCLYAESGRSHSQPDATVGQTRLEPMAQIGSPPATGQPILATGEASSFAALAARVDALESELAALKTTVNSLQSRADDHV